MVFTKNFVSHVLFGKYLFVTNVIGSSVLMAAGDGIQQMIDVYKGTGRFSWQRTRNMLSVGILLGPQQHVFYKLIDERYPCRTFTHIIRKLMLDQFISSPIYIVSFFVWCSVIERTTYEECIREIKSKFVTIYKIDCMIWPPSQLINFLYFSPKYRMLYVNFTTMIYDIVLSHVKYTAA